MDWSAIATISAAVITAIVGPIVTYLIKNRELQTQIKNNEVLQRQQLQKKPKGEPSDTGIKIVSPANNARVDEWFTVSGIYNTKPSNSWLQLFTTAKNHGYWAQGIASFDDGTKTWQAKVRVGGSSGSSATVVAALVGPEGQALTSYYGKVERETKQWPSIEVLTSDISQVDKITVVRR